MGFTIPDVGEHVVYLMCFLVDLITMISDASSLLKEVLQVVRKGNADLSLECVLLSKVLYHCSSGHRMQKYYHGLKKVGIS